MAVSHPKSIDGLMRYLRDKKGISIYGSGHKRKLMNIGYYHGYKGYRYINVPTAQVNYKSFDELIAVYDFDSQLKAMLYPAVMFIETAIKNYVLDVIVTEAKTDNFNIIYQKLLDNYKMFSTSGKTFPSSEARRKAEDKYKKEQKKRLELRNRIYRAQTEAFSHENKIAIHFVENNRSMPIWAIFELLTLGEFGTFVECLNQSCRKTISKKLGIRPADDSSAILPQRLIFATKDLRNAIAHNDIIFDARFRSSNIGKQVGNAILNASTINCSSFDTITDWIVLIVYQLKLLHTTKTELKHLISEYEEAVEKFRNSVPTSIFNQIIHTNNQAVIIGLRNYVSK